MSCLVPTSGAIGTTKGLFGNKTKSLPRTANIWNQSLNDIDSASDTSSTASTGPSSPGVFGLGSGKNDPKASQLDDFYGKNLFLLYVGVFIDHNSQSLSNRYTTAKVVIFVDVTFCS